MANNAEYSVIVIGAGIAGLSAAKYLAEAGRTVLIVEAKNRVGGRIHTLKTAHGTPIEMGANSLHYPSIAEDVNPLLPLLQHLNLRTQPIEPVISNRFQAENYFESAHQWIQVAKRLHWKTWPSLGEILKLHYLNFQKENSSKHTANAHNTSISAFIGLQVLTHMIHQQLGTSPQYVSLLELMDFNTTLPNSRENTSGAIDTTEVFISGGYQKLPEYFAEKAIATGKVKIALNSPIQSIQYALKDEKTQVKTIRNHIYTANSVLCTVPIGVLKKKALRFFPELSQKKQRLIKHIKIGFHNKIILEFEKIFWPPEVQFLFPGSTDYQHFPEYLNLFYFSNHKIPALVCNFYASEACFKEKSDEAIIEKALLPLQHLYGKNIPALKNAFVTHWDSDPYTLGSMSCCGLDMERGEMNNFEIPEPGGLFFAGAHTLTNKYRETVHGAYISGVRAALDIHNYLQANRSSKLTKHR